MGLSGVGCVFPFGFALPLVDSEDGLSDVNCKRNVGCYFTIRLGLYGFCSWIEYHELNK